MLDWVFLTVGVCILLVAFLSSLRFIELSKRQTNPPATTPVIQKGLRKQTNGS